MNCVVCSCAINLNMVKWCYNPHGTNHVNANVCVLQRKMAFSSMSQFHLASPLHEWKYGSNGWNVFPPLLYKKEQAYMKNILHSCLYQNRVVSFSAVSFVSIFSVHWTSHPTQHFHTYLWDDKPSCRVSLPGGKIALKVKDHNYLNFLNKILSVAG